MSVSLASLTRERERAWGDETRGEMRHMEFWRFCLCWEFLGISCWVWGRRRGDGSRGFFWERGRGKGKKGEEVRRVKETRERAWGRGRVWA